MASIHPSRLAFINPVPVPENDRYRARSPPRRRRSPVYYEATDLASRRAQRASTVINVWPPSPPAPARSLSYSCHHIRSPRRSKKSKRPSSLSDSSSSEDDRRRRERKGRKRARKEKDRSERRERKERRRGRSRSRSRPVAVATPPSPSPSPSRSTGALALAVPDPPVQRVENDNEGDSEEEVGPQPVYKMTSSKKTDERSYGGALLRGEGSAMAAFLQDGTDSRIPRRGEIGLTSDEIAQYEDVGYVMSGSRHRRMNAVRMRKENQVISAEEKRGILKLQREERERREAILREEFSELVDERLKGTEGRPK